MNKFSSRLNSPPPDSVPQCHCLISNLIFFFSLERGTVKNLCPSAQLRHLILILFFFFFLTALYRVHPSPESQLHCRRREAANQTTPFLCPPPGSLSPVESFSFYSCLCLLPSSGGTKGNKWRAWRKDGGDEEEKRGSMNKYRIENPQRNTENAGRTQRTSEED